MSLCCFSLSAFLPHPAHIVFAIRIFHSQKPHQLKETNKKRQSTQLLNVVVIIVVSFYDKAIIMTLFCTSKLQNKLSKSMALPKYTICKQHFFFFISSLSKPQDIIILRFCFCFTKKKKRNGIGFITFSYCTFQHSRHKLQLMFKFKHIIFIFGFRCMSFAFYMHLTSTVITITAPKECTNSSSYFTV